MKPAVFTPTVVSTYSRIGLAFLLFGCASPRVAGERSQRGASRGEVTPPAELPVATSERSAPSPAAATPPAEAPSVGQSCAERARHHALAEGRRRSSAPDALAIGLEDPSDPGRDCILAQRLHDLDGDGLEELDLQPQCGEWNKVWPHFIYLSRGCRFAGMIIDAELEPQDTATAGIRDIEATSSLGCAGLELTWNRYQWSGDAYARAATADCCFCEPAEDCERGTTHNRSAACRRLAPSVVPPP